MPRAAEKTQLAVQLVRPARALVEAQDPGPVQLSATHDVGTAVRRDGPQHFRPVPAVITPAQQIRQSRMSVTDAQRRVRRSRPERGTRSECPDTKCPAGHARRTCGACCDRRNPQRPPQQPAPPVDEEAVVAVEEVAVVVGVPLRLAGHLPLQAAVSAADHRPHKAVAARGGLGSTMSARRGNE